VPLELEGAVMHALARNPEFRPDSAAAFAAELASALPELATRPLPRASGVRATEVRASAATVPLRRVRSNWGRLLGRSRRRPVWLAAAAAVFVALVAAVAVALSTGGSPPAHKSPAAPAKEQTAVAQARELSRWLRQNAAPTVGP
jgi:hypothetical protein